MNVVIDATPLLLRSAGVKSYTWHWIRALRAAGLAVRAFPSIPSGVALDHERSALPPLATAWRLALVAATRFAPVLPRADVFHASNMVRSAPGRGRLTATIHDLTTVLMPEFHTPANVRADREFAARILSRAHRVIAISECTRRDAIERLRLDPARVDVVYQGIDQRFFEARPAPAARPYALCVGTIEPRKNIGTLLDAWSGLPADLRRAYDLVVAGPAGWNSAQVLNRLRHTPGVCYRGYVPEPELPALTAGAAAFVYPSLYEGFGLPPLQAMAAGVATVVSNTSAMPEAAGGAALLVDPRSPADIANALERVLGSPSAREALAAKGRARAAQFTWADSARASIDFFRRAIA